MNREVLPARDLMAARRLRCWLLPISRRWPSTCRCRKTCQPPGVPLRDVHGISTGCWLL